MLMAPSLRLPAAHGRDGGDIGPASANLDLDDADDSGHCYLAQTSSSTASAIELGGMSLHGISRIVVLRVVPLAMGPEWSLDDRIL